jgi:hypothetical protein
LNGDVLQMSEYVMQSPDRVWRMTDARGVTCLDNVADWADIARFARNHTVRFREQFGDPPPAVTGRMQGCTISR